MLRSPLLHFFIAGALLFGIERVSDSGRVFGLNRDTLQVSADEQQRISHELQLELHHAPNVDERNAALSQWIDEEVLVREALRLGLDQRDSVVRSRLIQNMRFAGDAKSEFDGAALLREAQRLGMDRSDLVVRRRLVQLMQRRLVADVRVGDDEARAYLAEHAAAYTPAPRFTFSQAFLSADRHRNDLDAAAQRLGAQLAREPARDDLGEPFLLGIAQRSLSRSEIAARYGAAVADGITQAPHYVWSGPLRSVYGVHFVRVTNIETTSTDRAQALKAAAYALLEQRQQAALRSDLAVLRARYIIAIDTPTLQLGDAR